jgi:peptide deformylase
MIREIIGVKDPRIRIKSKPVEKIDKKVRDLIKDLKDTLVVQKDPEGVGLAAPQIGKNSRVFAVLDEGKMQIFIDAEIIKRGKKEIKSKKKIPKVKKFLEGCLSLPHFYGPIRREESVTVKYMNEMGVTVTEEFFGFPAHVIQHEIDHLNGTIFVDRILEQDVPLYEIHGDKWEEVEL